MGRGALLTLAVALLLGAAPPRLAGQRSPLTLQVEAGAPVVAVGAVLADDALEEAVRSGLPVRMRFRVELWRDQLFDNLVQQSDWTAVLAFEPLERRFLVGADSMTAVDSYARARSALEAVYRPTMVPLRSGRYYYLAFLEIETLSLSDLDELEQWLRGELEPAVRGRGSVTGAVGAGLKRALIRVLDLPARRYQARSDAFRVR